MKLIFEKTKSGRKGYTIPNIDVLSKVNAIPKKYLRKENLRLPELSEVDVVRHFTELASVNYHIDKGFYPLGSCTMKYNPKVAESIASFEGFSDIHPLQSMQTMQGALQIIYELERLLAEIGGMDAVSLQPAAGAHGELAGLLIARAYFGKKGERRHKILIPDSAHGTNPASSVIAGFETIEVKSNAKGLVDVESLDKLMDKDVAVLMLTVPNTLGLFESEMQEISQLVHKKGGLLYLDGANLNAFLGITTPGALGFDIVHFNLHKTFGTPHGAGGPGGGGIGVQKQLVPFLPVPKIIKKGKLFDLTDEAPASIGQIHSFYGNFGVVIKAYVYIRMLGATGLKRVAENAVINSNYLMNLLKEYYDLPYPGPCMHEFVISCDRQKALGVRGLDVAKRLLDFGFHPPTVYFPLIVHEAFMIEPTETESKETLDAFFEAMKKIDEEVTSSPEIPKGAPYKTPVRRLDEVMAARSLDVSFYS
jgi:glycine dehydrogenase subunit 2